MIFLSWGTSHPREQAPRDAATDAELLAIFQAQPDTSAGRAAASRLLERYHRQVYRWCRGYTRDGERALDLAQEVLLDAYRGLAGFDARARFSSWLYAVARNRCLSAARRRDRLQALPDGLDEVPSDAPGPEAELAARQDDDALRAAIARHLAPHEADAIWLRAVERMTVDQITQVLGLEHATGARSVLQNARRKLRRLLDPRGGLTED